MSKKKSDKWIQSALDYGTVKKGKAKGEKGPANKGGLHRALGVPEGEKIPQSKLQKAAHSKGHLGKMARFAENVKGLRKGRSRKSHKGKRA